MKQRLILSGLLAAASVLTVGAQKKYNILCITCEDINPYLGCYGDKVAKTPNLDRFAEEAVRYTRMYTTVGVSAPSRAALITGMYPTAIGADNMRNYVPNAEGHDTKTPVYEVVLPEGVKCFTEQMRAAGYYCTNNAKTDYQFAPPLTAWDENGHQAHWKHRPQDMPFYSVFNLDVSHESRVWLRAGEPLTTRPEEIVVPSYYPDDPVIRRDLAVMYSNVTEMDRQFGKKIDELKQAGLYDSTIIVFYSDNGGPMPNQKREIYERGTLVPFMIRFPDGFRAGQTDDRLAMFVDIPATILSLAGQKPPKYMHGEAFAGKYEQPARQYIYGARDRMDEQVDKQGAVRDKRFRYLVNYMPEKPGYMPVGYRLQMPMMRRLLDLCAKDSLDARQKRWFEAPRPKEEFYDVDADPDEFHNLIADPAYAPEISRLKQEYARWLKTYNAAWMRPEAENIRRFKPGGRQPLTSAPVIQRGSGKATLKTATPGASVAYKINGKAWGQPDRWYLYTRPFACQKGDRVTMKADRAGYADSKEVTVVY